MAPVNNIERRAAKKLAASDGINYTEALRRIRNSGVAPSAVISGHAVSAAQELSTVDKAMDAIAHLGGTVLKNHPVGYKVLLTDLLESKTHPTLEANINIVLSKGTATGQAKAANALGSVLAEWESEKNRPSSVDLKTACSYVNASIISGWSLGNLLEEMDTTVPIDGYTIDLDAEKDLTELSSRVDAAIRVIPDFAVNGSSVRLIGRGMAALGLASLLCRGERAVVYGPLRMECDSLR